MTRDVILRIVKATRMAIWLAEDMQKLLLESNRQTWADEIAGQLADALFLISGEKLSPKQDFMKDSKTMRLLKSIRSDSVVADEFFQMANQPAPNTIETEAFNALYERNGGYRKPDAGKESVK